MKTTPEFMEAIDLHQKLVDTLGEDHPATDQARFLVECYGRTTEEAEWMCNRCREILRNAVATTVDTDLGVSMFVRGYGSETGVADYPNPEIIDRERWQFVCALDIKSN